VPVQGCTKTNKIVGSKNITYNAFNYSKNTLISNRVAENMIINFRVPKI
jgi:hypothetical protein